MSVCCGSTGDYEKTNYSHFFNTAPIFKLIGDSLILGTLEVLAEVFTLGEKSGIPTTQTFGLIKELMPAPRLVILPEFVCLNTHSSQSDTVSTVSSSMPIRWLMTRSIAPKILLSTEVSRILLMLGILHITELAKMS